LELFEVYLGRRTWEAYLGDASLMRRLEREFARQSKSFEMPSTERALGGLQLALCRADYRIAVESGFGAIGPAIGDEARETDCRIELSFEKLAAGLDRVNADFNLLLGDIIWKLEMHHEALSNILQEIRLAEFEREARAYRGRAERAYLNGWHQEALNDFLEAEKRNYPDFAVHRSIASIYLYHLINLPQALEYFQKAARYAEPSDARQAAEAHYFAGIVSAINQQLPAGIDHIDEAISLNPSLFEAYYQRSYMSAVLGEEAGAVANLEAAIKGDPRYYERARWDSVFDPIRSEVQQLLDRLMEPVQKKLAEIKHDQELLKRYVIAKPDKRERLSTIFERIDKQVSSADTFMSMLGQIQAELKSIYDLFFKQYELDGRDYVRSVGFSPDGRFVAAGFLYEGIKIWEVDSAQKVRSLRGHSSSVNAVAFSPNNDWLASASRDRTVRLWDVEAGRELRVIRGHEGEVRSVAYSPDGQWLASASTDQTVRIWRVVTGREVQTFYGHYDSVTSVAFSSDGDLVASGSLDTTVKLWETNTGRLINTLRGHGRGISHLVFSPDGRRLASGGEDKVVKVWDLESGRAVQTLTGHLNDVTSVAYSPDGELLAAGSLGQTIRVWKLATGRVIKTVWYPEISWNMVAFSPRGHWLALGSRDLELWLKTILTEDQYAQVKAGEEHALLMKYDRELSAWDRADLEWLGEEQAIQEMNEARKRARSECRICGARLTLLEKAARRQYCKLHR
jgi:WD40 repeat protein